MTAVNQDINNNKKIFFADLNLQNGNDIQLSRTLSRECEQSRTEGVFADK
jgi:hypothetical protein